jgi:N-acetylglucosaminyldiphosphoundecaprenol N-acetyl-beta-D-mannosaminyltransferase
MYQPATTNVWGLPFARVTMDQTIQWIADLVQRGVPEYLITANLNYVMLARQDPTLECVTDGAAGILADGMPIVLRSRGTKQPLPERVAGSELIYRLAEKASQRGWRIFFLGGAPGVAQQCAETLALQYPGLQIAGVHSPPFRNLSLDEQQTIVSRIEDAGTDILLVAFGQPKGERWIAEYHRQTGAAVSIQLGASFDFVAGKATRAPKVWQRAGMEWAYRMMGDPRRLVPRYASNAAFLVKTVITDLAQSVAHGSPARAR